MSDESNYYRRQRCDIFGPHSLARYSQAYVSGRFRVSKVALMDDFTQQGLLFSHDYSLSLGSHHSRPFERLHRGLTGRQCRG